MRIQHNIPAMNAYRNYNANTKALQGNLQKLSSGYKINKAGDDAAGLAISEKMRAQITGLEVAQKNAKDGISLVQTAEGAMTEIHTMLNRMFSLAEQSANGTYQDDVDREQLNNEFAKLTEEIDRIAQATNFNGRKLLDGSLSGTTADPVADIGTDAAGLIDPAQAANVKVEDVVKAEVIGGTDQQKADFNNALKNGTLKISFTDAGADNALANAAGDKITIDGLPDGYTVTTTDGAGDKMAIGNGVAVEFDAATGKIDSANPIELTFTKDGVDVGKITLDLSNSKIVDGKTTEITFADKTAATTNAGGAGGTATTSLDVAFGANADNFTNQTITLAGVDDDAVMTDLDGQTLTINYTGIGAGGNIKSSGLPTGYKLMAAPGTGTTMLEVDGTTGLTFGGMAANAATPTANSAWTLELHKDDGTGTYSKVADISITTPGTLPVAANSVALTFTKNTTPAGGGNAGGAGGTTSAATANGLRLRVGDSTNTYDDINVKIKSLRKDALTGTIKDGKGKGGVYTLDKLDVLNADNADIAMGALKDMINYVSTERGELGATQNRLDHTINNLATMQENMQDAEATIRDVDVAEEMMKYTKNNILVQSAQAMLAQANQLPQGVLQLLG